jgi:hypothetical protein
MKITSISVSNYIGLKDFNLKPTKKVLIVAGFNGAGKSSLAEGIRHALLGDYARVNFKKDLYQFLNEDAAAGFAIVDTTLGEFGVSLPSGDVAGESVLLSPALPFCLSPEKFAESSTDDRRKALFNLMGIKVSADEISRRLALKNADKSMIDAIRPYLSGGFKPAEKQAAEMARDEKANWRAITGESWGDKKADGWKAFIPVMLEVDADKIAIAEIEEKLAAENRDLGGLLEKQKTASKSQSAPKIENIEELRKKAAGFAQIQDDLNAAIKLHLDLADEYSAISIPSSRHENIASCPHCAGVVKIEGLNLSIYENDAYSKELADAKTKERAAKKVEMDAAVEKSAKLKTALAEADAAAVMLAALEDATENVGEAIDFVALINEKRAKIQSLSDQVGSLRQLQKDNEERIRAIKEAEMKIEGAAKINLAIKSWLLIADALSPEGIQNDLLSEALDPFNKELEKIANDSGWMKVRVNEAMEIDVDRQPYYLRSESEKWRADAMIAAAFAKISKSGLLILDRFDVLDLASRSKMMAWLAKSDLDQVIALGTMKAQIASIPDFAESVWLS